MVPIGIPQMSTYAIAVQLERFADYVRLRGLLGTTGQWYMMLVEEWDRRKRNPK